MNVIVRRTSVINSSNAHWQDRFWPNGFFVDGGHWMLVLSRLRGIVIGLRDETVEK